MLLGLGLEPADEPPVLPLLPLPGAEDEVVEDLVAVKVARLRVPLREIEMPEDPKLAAVPGMGMVPLKGILVVATMVLFFDKVRERVVAGTVTEADGDLVTDADEDFETDAGVAPEPPLMLNRPEKLSSDPSWAICRA